MTRVHGNQQKHENRNPLQRALIARFHRTVVDVVRRAAPTSLLDVGCGEGYVLAALHAAGIRAKMSGVDIRADAIACARTRLPSEVTLAVADVMQLEPGREPYDLVLMTEVLEHLPHPASMLSVLAALTRGTVVVSVPWEPFFMGLNLLRGRHVQAWGNDPGHVNHWGRRAFRDFVAQEFRVVEMPQVFPWTLVAARKR